MPERKILSEVKDHLKSDQISVITGARQTGKTTVLEQLHDFLTDKGEAVYLFTLEDINFLNAFNEHPENVFRFMKQENKRTVLLLDEIQYLDNPSNFLKLLYDKYKKQLKIVATGSSAFYIDKKFKDSLAGRKRIFELYPLDFEEFLIFREQDHLIADWYELKNRADYISPQRNSLQTLFEEYLTFGGYPSVVLEQNTEKKTALLKELFSSYLKRDMHESGIQNPDKFFNLITLLAHQCGSLLNINEMANTLQLSVTAIENYLYVMRKCYHINLVRPFYTNIRKELTKMPKIYFNDTGFRNAVINQFTPVAQRIDKGILIENYMYVRLRQIYNTDMIKFWRTADGNEVDFIIPENQENGQAIEVKFNQSEFKASKYKKFKTLYPGFPVTCRAYISESNANNIIGL